jgi:NADPH-dependent curcumin reductase CurA
MTAYFGLRNIGRPFPGDTVLISGAAGSTGSTVAQLARLAGCRVVGIARGPEKCRWLTEELGLDGAADYKAGDLSGQLHRLAPDGADIVWDNVGGSILNDMLAHLAIGARVVACGGISRHATGTMPVGPENYFNLIFKRATMSGFIVWDNAAEYPAARARMKTWIREGRLRYVEDVQSGLENAPRTLMRLYEGRNLGKQLLRLAD